MLEIVGITTLLVEFIGAVSWVCGDGFNGELQKTMGDLEHGYWITTDPLFYQRNISRPFI